MLIVFIFIAKGPDYANIDNVMRGNSLMNANDIKTTMMMLYALGFPRLK